MVVMYLLLLGAMIKRNILLLMSVIIFHIDVNASNNFVSVSPNSVTCWIGMDKESFKYVLKTHVTKNSIRMFWFDSRLWSKIESWRLRCSMNKRWFVIIYFCWKCSNFFIWGVGVTTTSFIITSCNVLSLILLLAKSIIDTYFCSTLRISPYTPRVDT